MLKLITLLLLLRWVPAAAQLGRDSTLVGLQWDSGLRVYDTLPDSLWAFRGHVPYQRGMLSFPPVGTLLRNGHDTLMYNGKRWIVVHPASHRTTVHRTAPQSAPRFVGGEYNPVLRHDINNIEWIVMLNDKDEFFTCYTIHELLCSTPIVAWPSNGGPARWMTYDQYRNPAWQEIHWYFCKQVGNQSIIVNPKP